MTDAREERSKVEEASVKADAESGVEEIRASVRQAGSLFFGKP